MCFNGSLSFSNQIAAFSKQLASKDPSPFVVHDWRNDIETIGQAPAEMVGDRTRNGLE